MWVCLRRAGTEASKWTWGAEEGKIPWSQNGEFVGKLPFSALLSSGCFHLCSLLVEICGIQEWICGSSIEY